MNEHRSARRWVGIDEYFDREGLSWAEVDRIRPEHQVEHPKTPDVDEHQADGEVPQ